jgi:PAS domain S-box-containing protein
LRLTTRLILLALVAVIPATIIQTYSLFELRRDRHAEVHGEALRQARLAASEIDRVVEGVRNLLTAVSSTNAVREFDVARCSPFLGRLETRVPHIDSIAVIDDRGRLRCASEVKQAGLTFGDRTYFQAAMAGPGFVVGEYIINRFDQRPVLPLALPIFDDTGKTLGVVSATLDLAWLSAELLARGIPPGGAMTIADRNGTILARQPEPDRFVGRKIAPEYMHLVTAPVPGSLEVTSMDGARRIVGYIPAKNSPIGLYVGAGLSAEQAFATVRMVTLRSAILLGLALLATIAVGLLAGRFFIKRPVDRLLETAAAWQRGDFSARTGLAQRAGDFGQIGEEMDRVAGEVARREKAIAESEERYRALVQASAAIEWRADAEGSMHDAPLWTDYTGQPPEAHRGWGWLDVVHPDDRMATRSVWSDAHRDGVPVEIEYRIHHAASGRYRWVHESGVPLRDADGTVREWVGAVTDIHERRQAEERQRLLVNELNHRVKNTLAIVVSIVGQTLRSSPGPDEALKRIQSRLLALSNTHDLLNETSWDGATLRDVLKAELKPYQDADRRRIMLEGPSIELDPKRAVALGLIVHELATNAAKYGSLSISGGRVEVSWRVIEEGGAANIDLTWREHDGPPLRTQGESGFGSRLIERSVQGDLGGKAELLWAEPGLAWHFSFPLQSEAAQAA